MSVWKLTAYDTGSREYRYREYTTSSTRAALFQKIPRIQFTDSGHGIVFNADPHRGKREPTITTLHDYVSEQMEILRND